MEKAEEKALWCLLKLFQLSITQKRILSSCSSFRGSENRKYIAKSDLYDNGELKKKRNY